ncbi:MAG: ABC transporter ATP-binding protein [Bacteroidales bacterium]
MTPLLQVNNLTKWFGKIQAVNSLTFSVNRGEIVGILGPNGSGKSTTLALLLGVKFPDGGYFRWFDNKPNTPDNKRIGSLLEVPYFFPYLNLKRNLELVARVRGSGLSDINKVLDMVGLLPRSKSEYYTLSLGMKQRLAIASALLGDPEVLILDEPTNGLDPEGIAEVRNLIVEQTQRGKTIIMASHILSEVEKVCTDVVILKNGEMLSKGPVGMLLKDKTMATVCADNVSALNDALVELSDVKIVEQKGGRFLVALEDSMTTTDLNRGLSEKGVILSELEIYRKTLESQFLEMVK